MAATFGAATRATFTAIVFLFELTRDYNSILPLMLATVLAVLVASFLSHDSIMTEKLTRRGLRVPADYHADVLRTTPVAAVMTAEVATVDGCARVAAVAERFRHGGHGAYPVVDGDGRCVGMISRGDLLRGGEWNDASPIADAASQDVVSVRSDESVIAALEKMLEEDVEHLPVIDDGRLVGICTRTDVMRARRTQLAHEHTEPGWLTSTFTNRRRNAGSQPVQ
jgi:CBS domain-containing protein